MAILDTFPVTVVNGDQLNAGYFNGAANNTRHLVTRSFSNTFATTTSSTMQDYITLNTPTSLKAGQVVFIDMVVHIYAASGDVAEYQLWNATDSSEIAIVSHTDSSFTSSLKTLFLQGTVTIASASANKSIKIRYRRVSGGTSVSVYGASITCMLVES